MSEAAKLLCARRAGFPRQRVDRETEAMKASEVRGHNMGRWFDWYGTWRSSCQNQGCKGIASVHQLVDDIPIGSALHLKCPFDNPMRLVQ